MRLSISFIAEQIPIDYRMMIVSLIKEALSQADSVYYRQLYEAKPNQMKPFATAVFLKNYTIQEKVIDVAQIKVIISSPDQEFVLHLYNGILVSHKIKYREYLLKRERIRVIPEKTIRSSTVLFRTLSPILIEDKNGSPLSPTDEAWGDQVNYYANLVLDNYRGFGLQKTLQVQAGPMKKQVIKETNHVFQQMQEGQWLYYTAYKGLILLTGEPADLHLLYQLGLSKRRSQSFGLLDVEWEGGVM